MTTHFGNQIPKYEDQGKWFFYNAYQAYCDGYPPVILPDLVKKIHAKGFTRIYLSMGSKYAKGQETVQKLEDFEEQLPFLDHLEELCLTRRHRQPQPTHMAINCFPAGAKNAT